MGGKGRNITVPVPVHSDREVIMSLKRGRKVLSLHSLTAQNMSLEKDRGS